MRTLTDPEVECVRDIALTLICERIIELTAEILGIPKKEARQHFITPEVRDCVLDQQSLNGFLRFWEGVIVQAVMMSDYLEDDDVQVTAVAYLSAGRLVTRVIIHDETDMQDD